MRSTVQRLISAFLVTGGLAACSNSSGPAGGAAISFNVSTKASAPVAAGMALSSAPITDGIHTIVLDTVKLVMKEIQFKRAESSVTTCPAGAGDNSDCEELEVGPLLVDLPLDPGVDHQFTVDVTPGTYDKLEFKIHTPEGESHGGDSFDSSFLTLHPEYAGISIHVVGTYDAARFVFNSNLDAEQEIELPAPLVVDGTTPVSVTLKVDLDTWFRNGTAVLDPSTANSGGANEGVVRNNIEASLQSFEDENHDGIED
jgi:hypothetical protein